MNQTDPHAKYTQQCQNIHSWAVHDCPYIIFSLVQGGGVSMDQPIYGFDQLVHLFI
jgi:hypothetical protein